MRARLSGTDSRGPRRFFSSMIPERHADRRLACALLVGARCAARSGVRQRERTAGARPPRPGRARRPDLDRHAARRPPAGLRLRRGRDARASTRCGATPSCSRTPTATRRSRCPSHASLLTGLLPPEHGVRDNIGYKLDGEARDARAASCARAATRPGPPSPPTCCARATGLDDGFDFYDDVVDGDGRQGRRRRAARRPRRRSRGRSSWLRGASRPAVLPLRPPLRAARALDAARGRARALRRDLRRRDRRGRRGASARCSTGSRELGRYDDALVVLASDHGEGLGDHGEQEHGILLYREALHVPLLVKLPRAERGGTQRGGARRACATSCRRSRPRSASPAPRRRAGATCSRRERGRDGGRLHARRTTRGSTSAGASCARWWTRATT